MSLALSLALFSSWLCQRYYLKFMDMLKRHGLMFMALSKA